MKLLKSPEAPESWEERLLNLAKQSNANGHPVEIDLFKDFIRTELDKAYRQGIKKGGNALIGTTLISIENANKAISQALAKYRGGLRAEIEKIKSRHSLPEVPTGTRIEVISVDEVLALLKEEPKVEKQNKQ